MNAPLFSFLTAAYKTEQYIGATIDSVVRQTRTDWELIVVDNGRSDEMARIVGGYAANDDRIKLVRQENRGYRGGVATAAEHATGSFVCVLDSDDELMPTFCARVAAVLEADPSIDVLGIDAYRFDGSGSSDLLKPYMRSVGVTVPADPKRRLTLGELLNGRIPYYTAAVRRAAWDAVGGYEPGVDDVDESVILWCRLVERYNVRLIPDRLARYRIRPDSLSRLPENVEAFEDQLMRSFVEGGRVTQNPEHLATLDATLRRLRYLQEIRRGRSALVSGDTATARRAARAAFRQRRTVRAGLVVMSLTLAPGLMRRIHPIKRRVSDGIETVAGRVAGLRRA